MVVGCEPARGEVWGDPAAATPEGQRELCALMGWGLAKGEEVPARPHGLLCPLPASQFGLWCGSPSPQAGAPQQCEQLGCLGGQGGRSDEAIHVWDHKAAIEEGPLSQLWGRAGSRASNKQGVLWGFFSLCLF